MGVPTFIENFQASRLIEPVQGLSQIAGRASALADGRPAAEAYPESVGRTPEVVPAGSPVVDPPGTWEHATWRLLSFEWTAELSYSFTFEQSKLPGRSVFVATANGDLDGDGVLSTFQIAGECAAGKAPVLHPMEISREVE